jgi:SAM-dependent methyltransferase
VLRPWAERLLDAVRPQRGERVLDCPCDSGVLTRRLARAVGGSGMVLAAEAHPGAWVASGADAAPVRTLGVDPARLPLASGSLDAAVSLLGLHLVPDPAALLAEMLRVVDRRHGRVGVLLQLAEGSPHETAVAAALGGSAAPPAVPASDVAALVDRTAHRSGAGSLRLHAEIRRDVVRFDGVDQLWTALVTERGVEAVLTPARRSAVEASLDRCTVADGTLRIPVEAVLLHAEARALP